MVDRLPIDMIDTTGATAGDVPVYNPTTDELEYAPPASGGASTGATDPLGANLEKVGIVLPKGTSGQWDATLVESPAILRDPRSGRYAMVHTGYGTTTGATRGQIGLAWSDDLVNWTKTGTPMLTHSGVSGDPDENGCTGPLLLWDDAGDQYVLYYIGLTATGYESGTKSLCMATSADLTTWTRHGAVITTGSGWRSGAIWHPSVVERDGTWYLFFNATGSGSAESIGYATAPAITGPWTVDDTNSPLLSAVAATWESTLVGDPSVRRVGDMWVMDYYGFNGTTAADGIAVTSDADFPLGWERHPDNPILSPSETYDAKYAHKPFVMVNGGELLHYYTAVAADDTRQIALAISKHSLPAVVDLSGAPAVSGLIEDGSALDSLLDSLATVGLDVSLGTALVADDFDRADGALGTTSVGSKTWQYGGGTGWAIVSDEAKWTGASDGAAMVDSGLADDYAIEFTLAEVNGSFPIAVLARGDSTTTYVKLFRSNGNGDWRIAIDGGSVSSGGASGNPAAGDVIRVEVTGTTYKLYRNGVLQGTWTGVTAHHTGADTLQGVVGSGGNVARIDDFSVTSLSASASGITVQDEGGTVATGVTQIDFQGAGVDATAGTGEVVVTIPAGLTAEDVRDTIAAALVAGTGITITVDDGGDTITISSSAGGLTAEDVRDTIAAALVAGTGISITVDDAGDTITIANTGGGGGSTETWEDVVTALTGKVHRWKFDDASGSTVDDSVGSLDLTLSGTYTRAVNGLLGTGTATTFGASAKAVSSGLGSIPTGGNARCIIVLHKSTAASNTKQCLISYGPTGSTRQWFSGVINDGAANRLCTEVWADDLLYSGVPTVGEWHLAAFGYDGVQNIFAYSDGLISPYRLAAALNTGTSGNFQVGLSTNNDGQYAGTIEDVIVLNNWPGKRVLDRLYRAIQAL